MDEFIIELPDNTAWLQWVKVAEDGTVCFDYKYPEDLTPYTEPDLEQIRKEAYEDGYKTAKVQCNIQAEKDMREVGERHYQKGLSDAWDAAKKIADIWESGENDKWIIVDDSLPITFASYSASEAIEKIRQHEQEKEQSFTTEEVMRQYLDIFCKGRSCTNCPLCTPDFTCGRGKHFLHDCVSDEEIRRAYVAAIVKMKES